MNVLKFNIGLDQPFLLISGPCIIESENLTMEIAESLKNITTKLNIPFIYKASFDKANRSSISSFRGLGIDKSLQILEKVKKYYNVPIITDVHNSNTLHEVASVVDILQTPAFLCRQTDFITDVCKTGLPVNIKKGQFLSPWDMIHVVKKAKATGNNNIMVCERGVSFGYNNLVSDMRSLSIMRNTKCPVIFDVTHSVQLPGGLNYASGGQREFVPLLSRSAIAAGISGLFMETHPNPKNAKSDGPNSWPLHLMEKLLCDLKYLDDQVKKQICVEDNYQ